MARRRLIEDPASKRLLPNFVRFSNDAASVQSALSSVASGSGSWAIRRGHVTESFIQLLTFLESGGGAADATITDGLDVYDAPAVQVFWAKALDRRATDPDGAVTAASTLLEEVCKHIIEDSGAKWEAKWNVPKLYNEAANVLKLAPSHHRSTRKKCSKRYWEAARASFRVLVLCATRVAMPMLGGAREFHSSRVMPL